MRFMCMHKMTDAMEQGVPPGPEVMEGVGKLIEDALAQKVFVSGEGLKPSSQRLHVRYAGGKRTVTNGPFTDVGDLVAGFALLRVQSKEEALSWLDRFAGVLGDVEIFLGPIVEPWDFGAPKPENAPLRFLSTHKVNERKGHLAPPDPALMAKMGALIDEMTKAGVLEAAAGLTGTEKGTRVRFEGGKHRVIDGPFAESKELIAGYAIFDLPSMDVAVEWGKRFGDIVKVNEIEIRPMQEG